MQIVWLISKIIVTLVAIITCYTGNHNLLIHYSTIKESKPQLWFYTTGLATIIITVIYEWFKFKYDVIEDSLYIFCCTSIASFEWC
jgi:hypothetical protein